MLLMLVCIIKLRWK